ncbi:hypothetical protein [Lachnoclostridium sp. An76]|uniref:hypothetical protein n=1 Tax=Lachnoclostridium sp. An76 TaxID=1965654 RepID=UPI000B3A4DF0|nr:hypothetical protein [Lachnoclostridium sp. An76]OUN34747.1 hypothetical protein B5G27_08495 [Lachnoclostridium sp. An76]
MDTYTLVTRYGLFFIIEVFAIWFVVKVFKRKKLIELDTIKKSKEKWINILLKIVIGAWLIIINIGSIYPALLDIPYVINKDYKFIKGFAASSDTGKTDVNWHMRSFWVKSGSKKVYVEARTSYVHVGDYIEVLYLPNSHLGTVIRRTESEE